MKIQYIDKEGSRHTLTFHEDDLQEAIDMARDHGAKEATVVETGEKINIEKQ